VLAQQRRSHHRSPLAADTERRGDVADGAQGRVLHLDQCAACGHLLILQRLPDGVHRPGGNARGAERGQPLAVRAAGELALDIGPVIDAGRVSALGRLVDDAVERGARVLRGGGPVAGAGHFFAPTVLADVPADAEIMREEPFGPIAIVNRVDDLDAAIECANATDYAFAAYVFTNSLSTRERVIAELRASNVGINQMAPSLPDAPLGGLQDSGVGYEGGRDGIAAFQHRRLVSETGAT
jgi:succinate-semialdehyde dehydrogenase / glutarate-semialdehyde dehydrogenase